MHGEESADCPIPSILIPMAAVKSPLRQRFERERRRAAFLTFLPGMAIGIIVADTWISPLAGIPGGLGTGALAYAIVWAYETFMWRKHRGK